jgi:hypothetical protein
MVFGLTVPDCPFGVGRKKYAHGLIWLLSQKKLQKGIFRMTVVQQQEKITQPPVEGTSLNAERATSIAVEFLKTLGNKYGVKPRKVSLQELVYLVELDVGKDKTATVQIGAQTRDVREYEIKTKEKEESGLNLPLSPKTLIIFFGISAAVYLIFEFLKVPSLLFGR